VVNRGNLKKLLSKNDKKKKPMKCPTVSIWVYFKSAILTSAEKNKVIKHNKKSNINKK
tara:strand:- start:361 stop:534 length:174 start_codon:yes stop_codon:yes gene_type:complete